MTLNDVLVLLPLNILLVWSLLLLVVDLWIPKTHKGITALCAALGLAVSAGSVFIRFSESISAFNGMVVVDNFARFLDIVFLVSGIGTVALAYRYIQRQDLESGEYYILLLFSISGMVLMTYANDLIIVFLALELLSIPLYILCGIARPRLESEEASLKYFLMGTFSSGFVLYGIALIFAATAHTDLAGIVNSMNNFNTNRALLLAGTGLLLVGFGFKIAAVPFHMWVPDVYQGAPTSVTAFMSIGTKAAGIAALLRVVAVAFPTMAVDLTPILWGMAALTMVVGHVLAIVQTNIKRLLAYSSIANAGYLLMAFVPYGKQTLADKSIAAMLFYLAAYAVTSLGVWAVVISLERSGNQGLDLADYAGLGKKNPMLALAMAVFMLSFIGVPLTLGFWGKFYLFRTAVEGGYVGLALIGLLTSLISAYYYLRIVVIMYMQPGEPQVNADFWLRLTAGLAAALVVLLAFVPAPLLNLAVNALLRVK